MGPPRVGRQSPITGVFLVETPHSPSSCVPEDPAIRKDFSNRQQKKGYL